jgi:hypothetical protein
MGSKLNPGSKGHTLYATYSHMKRRCYETSNKDYRHYGARGITVCDRWLGVNGFWHFVEDMGTRPSGYSIDRVDNSKGYSPDNCRWASTTTQVNNTRRVEEAKGYFKTKYGTFKAYISISGKNVWLGSYSTESEAHNAYINARDNKLIKMGRVIT